MSTNSHRHGKAGVVVLLLLMVVAGAAYCFPQYLRLGTRAQPPVAASVRPSLVGAGRVLQLRVIGNEPLTDVRVEAVNRARNGRASYRFDSISPGQLKELGWMEWNWSVDPGETITVSARDYTLPITFSSEQLGVR